MRVVQVGYEFDELVDDPDRLLDRYPTLTGWSEALLGAGASAVSVVHRLGRDATIRRRGVDYLFVRDGAAGRPRRWWRAASVHVRVAARGPDVVHVNGTGFYPQTWWLRRALDGETALVVQDHGGGVPRGRGVVGGVQRRLMRAPDGYLFTAVAQADPWLDRGLIRDRRRVHAVVPAGTTLRPVDRDLARDVSGVRGRPALLWVGRLNANKDPLTVLEGFDRALPDLGDATLTMVYGEIDELPAVQARLATSPALGERVRLAGRLPPDRMAACFSAADIFVVGSHHEGSGYALIEACACGALPVVTDIPSFRAITGGGHVGVLWKPGDALQCSRALVAAVRRDLEVERRAVRDHFERHLSWEAVGRRALEVYGEIRARRGAGT